MVSIRGRLFRQSRSYADEANLINLLFNAIKYNKPGAPWRRGQPAGKYCRISVSDTGTGLAPSQLAAIPTIQSPGQKRTEQGTGIGLVRPSAWSR
jgi:signal transduction histidine kinase